ncbi:MAG: ribosome recycling factor [Bacteroidia bacterium]|nr:MAG: ribosome recycling factor [Bacteroidia bacterium]
MNEEVELYLEDAQESMGNAVKHLEKEFVKVRAGRANPQILDGIKVDYYGVETPLAQVANLSVLDARTLVVQPWEKTMIKPIEKAIMKANIGLNPANNGEIIRINIPPLTEQRRKELVKQVRSLGENAKVSVRNSRRDTNDALKKMQKEGLSEDLVKDAENEVQKYTKKYSDKIDELTSKKESEIMTV